MNILAIRFPLFALYYLSHPRFQHSQPCTVFQTLDQIIVRLAPTAHEEPISTKPKPTVANSPFPLKPVKKEVKPAISAVFAKAAVLAALDVYETLAWCPDEECLPG